MVSEAFGGDVEVELLQRIWASPDYLPDLELVAMLQDRVVGHVLNSRAHVGQIAVVALGPLAVAPTHQRTGIGSALMTEVIHRASAVGETMIGLLGHPTYYPRFGFRRGTELGVLPPTPMADDAPFMLRALNGADVARGTFRYSSAFDGV